MLNTKFHDDDTIDFSNCEVGQIIPKYDNKKALELCPLCSRVGISIEGLQGDKRTIVHVVSSVGSGWWVSDFCNIDDNAWAFASPATELPNRVKHPWEGL